MFTEHHLRLAIGIAVLLVMVWGAIFVIRRIRQQATEDGGGSSYGMMGRFREMYQNGELSEEEYRSIRESLTQKIRQELHQDEAKGKDQHEA